MVGRIVLMATGLVLAWHTGGAIAAPVCSENIEEIVPQLLADLPSYGNRVIQRARKLSREEDTYSYILVASQPDFRPIPLRTLQYTPTATDTTEQIFFTTLNKQYLDNGMITFENDHWLFLTPSTRGWAIVHLFTGIGGTPQNDLPIPPIDATQSIIGRATEIWLRDYNAHCSD